MFKVKLILVYLIVISDALGLHLLKLLRTVHNINIIRSFFKTNQFEDKVWDTNLHL